MLILERLTIKEIIIKKLLWSFFEGVNRILLLLCREIMLYNEFVPAMEHELHQWEYSVYWHYDEIEIGKNN